MALTLDDIKGAVKEVDVQLIEDEYPDVVPGRTAHIDADFLAYMTSYEREGEDISLEQILFNTDTMITSKRREAGAEFAVLHLTPKESNKGGRYEAAIQKKYQDTRSSDRKPRHLEAVRAYMGEKLGNVRGALWMDAEADDGMAQAAWSAYEDGLSDQVVIVTKDKDLRMCPGLHMDWDTGILRDQGVDLFGELELRVTEKKDKDGKVRKTKKVWGYGTKWFWCQMLQGDTADNIKGCPHIMVDGKRKPCGQIAAFEALDHTRSDREALNVVMNAYKGNSYIHWETGERVEWKDVFWSEAQMLWMQRTPGDINDVKDWVKKEVLNG